MFRFYNGNLLSNAPGERRPTGTEPRRKTEPALWAVRSTGWLGWLLLKRGPGVRAYALSRRRPALQVQLPCHRPITVAPPPVPARFHPYGTASVHAQIRAPVHLNRVSQ